MSRHRTVAGRSRFAPDPVKGSRFVATVAHVATEAEAMAVVDEVRAEWPDATHHCWAWRLRDGERARSSDAGEPGGSAGRPILAQIEGHGLHDVVVVVSRWFGGTKLGVGGLVRAYGGTAGMALDRAEILEVADTVPVRVEHGYGDTGAVDAVVASERLERVDTEWGEGVAFTLHVPVDGLDRVVGALRDATAGRARVTPLDGPQAPRSEA